MLIDECGTGFELSGECVKFACSYKDLGQAIVELALERGYDSLSEVGVSSKGGDRLARYLPSALGRMVLGMLMVYAPDASEIWQWWYKTL